VEQLLVRERDETGIAIAIAAGGKGQKNKTKRKEAPIGDSGSRAFHQPKIQ